MQNEINDTRLEYIKRINLVLDFTEKNLDSDLSLEKLSKKAFYSSFHFHRIMDYTYFPIVPKSIKQLKVKFAIVFIHHEMRFGISLGGQNRQIQKQYWKIFKESAWNDYQIPSTIDENFTIVYDVLVENPNFNDLFNLTKQIESKSMKFIEDITEILN